MAIIMPAAIIEPAIPEMPGLPEVFAVGAVVRDGADMIRVLFWTEAGSGPEPVLRVVMPRRGFDQSLVNAWARWGQKVH